MELRSEIEPQLDIAEKHYPEILRLILAYTGFCDENGDEDTAIPKLQLLRLQTKYIFVHKNNQSNV